MLPSFADEGIIIKIIDYGEADKLIWVVSRYHGYHELIAKGARRPTSKKSSHLDLLNRIKFQTARGTSPQFLIQAESVNTFSKLKADLKLSQTCFYLCEILNAALAPEQQDEQLYQSLFNYLNLLNHPSKDPQDTKDLTINFQLYLLRHLGYPLPDQFRPDQLPRYFEIIIGKKLHSSSARLV